MKRHETLEGGLEFTLAWHEAFRRLGILPKDIYFSFLFGPDTFGVEARQGELKFGGPTGFRGKHSQKHIAKEWSKITLRWNDNSPKDEAWRKAIWANWLERVSSFDFVMNLQAKGFSVNPRGLDMATQASGAA